MTDSRIQAEAILRTDALIVLGNFPNPAPVVVVAKHADTTEADLTAAMQGSSLFSLADGWVELTEAGWKFYREQHGEDDEGEET